MFIFICEEFGLVMSSYFFFSFIILFYFFELTWRLQFTTFSCFHQELMNKYLLFSVGFLLKGNGIPRKNQKKFHRIYYVSKLFCKILVYIFFKEGRSHPITRTKIFIRFVDSCNFNNFY